MKQQKKEKKKLFSVTFVELLKNGTDDYTLMGVFTSLKRARTFTADLISNDLEVLPRSRRVKANRPFYVQICWEQLDATYRKGKDGKKFLHSDTGHVESWDWNKKQLKPEGPVAPAYYQKARGRQYNELAEIVRWAEIAQSVVHLLGKEKVVGSNPTLSSKELAEKIVAKGNAAIA